MIETRRTLSGVRYELRGTLARRARALEADGRTLIRLNIGNPGAFGFEAPDHLRSAVAAHVGDSEPYGHQQGLPRAREVLAERSGERGVPVPADQVFLGNGVSELIDISLRALLNPGDEVLIPSPDYPLWTASATLNDGRAIHYPCRPERAFTPDPDEVEALVTPRTRALVIINPNNPTGASYPLDVVRRLVAVAARHDLLLLVDEIYDDVLFDDARFHAVAPLAGSVPCLTYGGLSKVHRACGWRVGWAVLSGDPGRFAGYREALELLCGLRLCAGMPGQFAIEAAVRGPDTVRALCQPGGRLHEARRLVMEGCAASPHLELSAPLGALYAFPTVTGPVADGFDDYAFALTLLETQNVLLVPGSSFNFADTRHFRMTLLPPPDLLAEVFGRIGAVLDDACARVASSG